LGFDSLGLGLVKFASDEPSNLDQHRLFQRIFQIGLLKRLLQHHGMLILAIESARAIARQENEGATRLGKRIGDWITAASVQIEIEDREIRRLLPEQIERLFDRGRDLHVLAADLEQRVFDEHGDDGFVFCDKHLEVF